MDEGDINYNEFVKYVTKNERKLVPPMHDSKSLTYVANNDAVSGLHPKVGIWDPDVVVPPGVDDEARRELQALGGEFIPQIERPELLPISSNTNDFGLPRARSHIVVPPPVKKKVRFPPVGEQVEKFVEIKKVGPRRSKLKRGRVKSLTVDEARAAVRNNPHTVTRKQRGIVSRREKETSRRAQELADE